MIRFWICNVVSDSVTVVLCRVSYITGSVATKGDLLNEAALDQLIYRFLHRSAAGFHMPASGISIISITRVYPLLYFDCFQRSGGGETCDEGHKESARASSKISDMSKGENYI